MSKSLYSFSDVEAKNHKPDTLRDAIKSVLRADNDAAYQEMEPYLISPGRCGSKYFDQCQAVNVLVKHDYEGEGRIARMRAEKPSLNERVLWDVLCRVLREVGFDLRHGRLAGLLAHDSEDGQNKSETEAQDAA